MQDVTPWPTEFDVSEPVARVLVDGQEVDVESVTVSSELDSAMPERVAAGGGGVVAATGTASILRTDEVSEAGFNPWGDAQRFVEASEVIVEAGYREPSTGARGFARQITGQVESLDGGATDNSVQMEFVDYTPTLDQEITIEPLLQEYPPLEDWGPKRGAGLSPIYITDRVLRHCGFYATPPMIDQAVLSAPMMGSALPERGTMVSAWASSDDTSAVAFRPVSWGMALGNGVISYSPDVGARGHARLTSTLHVSFQRFASTNESPASGRIELRWGSQANALRVETRGDHSIWVWYRDNYSWEPVVSLPSVDVRASETFTVLVTPAGQATIHASNGATATGAIPLPPRLVSHSMDEVYVLVPASSHPIGGVQVAFSTDQHQRFQRTAHLDPPASYHSLRAFPHQGKVNCLALLKDQAEAELAAMWIDEHGHFRWRNRHRLRGAAPKGTLTSKDHLLDLPWSVPVRSVFSRVELEHEVATITRRGVPSITVSENRGETLSNGETEDRFFEPPSNQDWHQIEAPTWIGSAELISFWALRRGRHSYYGGAILTEDRDDHEALEVRIADSPRMLPSWQQINPQRWLLSYSVQDLASDEYIEQRFLDRPDLYGKFAREPLPLIRAKGLVEWEQATTTGTVRGPQLSPVYVHKVGPWIQETSELQSLADWLAAYLTTPDVILRRIPIVPDPRIQLGDVFWLEDQSAYHIRARVVVMGKKLSYQATKAGYEMVQSITCRVIDVERLGVRYDELQAAWAGRDYAALENAWDSQDYESFAAAPLDRSEEP